MILSPQQQTTAKEQFNEIQRNLLQNKQKMLEAQGAVPCSSYFYDLLSKIHYCLVTVILRGGCSLLFIFSCGSISQINFAEIMLIFLLCHTCLLVFVVAPSSCTCDPGQITNYLSLCYLLSREKKKFFFWLQFCKMHETLKQKIQQETRQPIKKRVQHT